MFLGSIKRQLDDFLLSNPNNIVADLDGMRIFDPCLLAVASTDDALWEKLKQPDVIGPPHLSPAEWLEGAQSVICCFLPYTSRVRFARPPWTADLPLSIGAATGRSATRPSSPAWARSA